MQKKENTQRYFTLEEICVKSLKQDKKYLDFFIQESIKEYQKTKDLENFLKDLKYIAEAKKGSLQQVAKETHMTRQTLYNIFNNKNFTFSNFTKLLNVVDININFNSKTKFLSI